MGWNGLRALLDTRMAALPGASAGLIAWPGVDFTPPTPDDASLWWRVDLLPAVVSPEMGPSGAAHESGIYQVTVYAKRKTGSAVAFAAVDAVVAHFDRYRAAGSGVTAQCGVPTPGPIMADAQWLSVPVSIPFYSL